MNLDPVTPLREFGVDEIDHVISVLTHLRDGTITPGDPERQVTAEQIQTAIRSACDGTDKLMAWFKSGDLLKPRGEGWD